MILFLALLPALAAFVWVGYRWRVVARTRGDEAIGYYFVYSIASIGILIYIAGVVVTYCIGLIYA